MKEKESTWFIGPGLKACGHPEETGLGIKHICACYFYGEQYHQDRHVYPV